MQQFIPVHVHVQQYNTMPFNKYYPKGKVGNKYLSKSMKYGVFMPLNINDMMNSYLYI